MLSVCFRFVRAERGPVKIGRIIFDIPIRIVFSGIPAILGKTSYRDIKFSKVNMASRNQRMNFRDEF